MKTANDIQMTTEADTLRLSYPWQGWTDELGLIVLMLPCLGLLVAIVFTSSKDTTVFNLSLVGVWVIGFFTTTLNLLELFSKV